MAPAHQLVVAGTQKVLLHLAPQCRVNWAKATSRTRPCGWVVGQGVAVRIWQAPHRPLTHSYQQQQMQYQQVDWASYQLLVPGN